MGWNTATWTAAHPYLEGLPDGTRFYFVHSFAPPAGEPPWRRRATASRSPRPSRADNVFATQFHPEKSGDAGLHVYERFVRSLA